MRKASIAITLMIVLCLRLCGAEDSIGKIPTDETSYPNSATETSVPEIGEDDLPIT